jgi:hypothetical protein
LTPLRSLLLVALLALPSLSGCATSREAPALELRERVEEKIHDWGLQDDPAIAAQRAEVDAAFAREDDSPVVDGIELRTAVVHENGEKVQMLVRMPFDGLFSAQVQREARRAATLPEIARLE